MDSLITFLKNKGANTGQGFNFGNPKEDTGWRFDQQL